jgi:hypothetical protein
MEGLGRDDSPFAEGSWSKRELVKQYLDMDFMIFMLFIILHSKKWVHHGAKWLLVLTYQTSVRMQVPNKHRVMFEP